MTVFISYRHVDPDQGLADELYRGLIARGHEVFIDKRISIGTEWAKEIQQAIAKARFFVVLLSPEAILSDMLRQEVALAHERRRDGALTILPVRMDFTGDLGYDLASYLNPLQYALWQAGVPSTSVIEEVVSAIESRAALSHEAIGEADALALAALRTVTEGRGAPLLAGRRPPASSRSRARRAAPWGWTRPSMCAGRRTRRWRTISRARAGSRRPSGAPARWGRAPCSRGPMPLPWARGRRSPTSISSSSIGTSFPI